MRMNVLLTSAGRRVELLEAFRRELARLAPGGRVLAGDASPWSAALRVADEAVLLPRCDDPRYVDALLGVVARRRVRLVVPLIDPELPVLAGHRDAFARAGCELLVCDPAAVAIARHKGRTAARFRELGVRAPEVLDGRALAAPDRLRYPLFVKPAAGSSSIGAVRVDDPDALRFWLPRLEAPVVESFERGQEYTIDVLADLGGRVRCAVPRQRLETRAGEISKGRTAKDPRLMAAARAVVEGLGGCRGCVTLQCFDPGPGEAPVFFEANLRFGGGFPLSYAAGANYPGWILEMVQGRPVRDFDGWQDGLVMLRYDAAVYFPDGAEAPAPPPRSPRR
jgi:carbamoyl-phosphate synthase large subunit